MGSAMDNVDAIMRDVERILDSMPKKSTSKKLTDVEKAVRNLIREELRSLGIEHVSSTAGSQSANYVATISYAQHSTSQTRYIGPLFFYYDLEGTVICRRYYRKEIEKEIEDRMISIIGPSYINTFSNARDLVEFEEHHFDVYDPQFHEHIGAFVDQWVPRDHRDPAKHKTLKIVEGDVYYIPDKEHDIHQGPFTTKLRIKKPTRRERFKAWIKRVWSFAWGESSEDYYWTHALKRHFGICEYEIGRFYETVEALRRQDQKKIEEDTETILKNHD